MPFHGIEISLPTIHVLAALAFSRHWLGPQEAHRGWRHLAPQPVDCQSGMVIEDRLERADDNRFARAEALTVHRGPGLCSRFDLSPIGEDLTRRLPVKAVRMDIVDKARRSAMMARISARTPSLSCASGMSLIPLASVFVCTGVISLDVPISSFPG